MYTGVDKGEVTAKIQQAGENPAEYMFYQTGDVVTAVPFGSDAPEGGVLMGEAAPAALPDAAPDAEPMGEIEGAPAGTATPTQTAPMQIESKAPDPTQPLGQFSQAFIQNMRNREADRFRKPVQRFFGALGGMGRSFQGKDSGFMTDRDKATYQTRLLNLLAAQEEAAQSSLKAALSGQTASLEGLETMYKEQSDIFQTVMRNKEASAQAAMKEQSQDLRQRLDRVLEEKRNDGWQGYSSEMLRLKNVSNIVNDIMGSDLVFTREKGPDPKLMFRSQGNRNTGKAAFGEQVLGALKTMDASQKALFLDVLNNALGAAGLQSSEETFVSAGNRFYETYGQRVRQELRMAEIAKAKRLEADEKADETIREIEAQQSARVRAYLENDPDYKSAQTKMAELEAQIKNARQNVGKLSYTLSTDGGGKLTPESWAQATQKAMNSATQSPTTAAPPPPAAPAEPAAPPPPQAEPEPVEAAPAEAPRVQDGQYEYQQRPDGSIDIFKAGQSKSLMTANPGTEAFTNAKKVIDAQPAPAEPEPAPAPPAPAVGEGDSPQPSPTAPDEAKQPGPEVRGLELAPEGSSPADVALHLLNTGGDNSKRFQQEVMASPMFEKFMKDKGLTDPRLGWKAFTSEFRYRSSQQKRMDRRKIDEEIIQDPKKHSRKEVTGAKLRSATRRMFAPRDAAGNPTTRWERSFMPKPNPAAKAASETPTDNDLPENKAKTDELKKNEMENRSFDM
ncbi:MAG: hypothetical protein Unbinned80contig1000_5 [Prokaryotic dsDNA virus sp.]|nr:MAG: hypothetical protein Unbinned80contig1000_5 [Prokaryotic dsDNA virus sp.]